GHLPVVTHTYPSPGNYTVRLSVTDPTRRTATLTRVLEVNRHDPQILPDFSWTPAEATVKDTFLLDASATGHSADSGRIFTYAWEIKNEQKYGPFGNPQFPHVFWFYGQQEVTLTATDQYGLSNSITKGFYVIKENKPPVPRIRLATAYGNIRTHFYISAWPSGDDVTPPSRLLIRWDFDGDGTWDTGWSYEKLVFHQYANPGTYWVILEAEDEGGERGITRAKLNVSSATAQTGYILDSRDGNYYGTVKIGNQWWMSDNLDYRTPWKIIQFIPMLQRCYKEEERNCDQYGSLYQGDRTISYDDAGYDVCPSGWRLPTKADWETMAGYAPPGEGRDAFLVGGSLGFNARLTGYGWFELYYLEDPPRIDTAWFYEGLNREVMFFSATRRPQALTERAQFHFGLVSGHPNPILEWSNRDYYYYVRCLKDD
ncbi:MAG: FISUMP domain-containing protein, partial [Bacteroidales bacterium]